MCFYFASSPIFSKIFLYETVNTAFLNYERGMEIYCIVYRDGKKISYWLKKLDLPCQQHISVNDV